MSTTGDLSHGVSCRDPLLTTKLRPPPASAALVPRPRLTERLQTSEDCRMTLVSAPAGYGKTTLVVDWLQRLGRPFCWLSLDSSDNDAVRFNAYLLAALRTVDARIGRSAEDLLRSPQPPPPEVFLTALVNDIATTPQPFVLAFDDYRLVTAPAIQQELAFLLEHQTPHLHMAILTREDPPLPLARWRAGGQMNEIRKGDLTFTEAESADFLRRVMRLDLSAADIATLHRRTEGWVVGLQLAALSLRGRKDARLFVESFAGSHRYVLDYLMEEVFQRQPAEVQDFLLIDDSLGWLAVLGFLAVSVWAAIRGRRVRGTPSHRAAVQGKGEGGRVGGDVPVFPSLLILIGSDMLLRPWFEKGRD